MSSGQHRLAFESFGVIAEVVCEDGGIFDAVPDVLPPGWCPSAGKVTASFELRADGEIRLDGTRAARAGADRGTWPLELGSVIRHHLALRAPDRIFVHAGVARYGDGAIVIPGSSFTGKTTLIAELVRAGATYYSDEYAVVDSAGMIEPYPKPLSIRGSKGDRLGRPVPVPEAQIATQPIRARMIVVTSFRDGANWSPAVRTSGEGAFALLVHTVAARSSPGRALAAVCRMSAGSEVLSGPRGEAREVVQALLGASAPSGIENL